MNRLAWTLWALVPVLAVVVHFGWGSSLDAETRALAAIARAKEAEASEQWLEAADHYQRALNLLQESEGADTMPIRISRAKARMMGGEYLEGQEELETLLAASQQAGSSAPSEELTRLRTEVALAGYYAAWAMRLEGGTEEEWLPESEKARENFRHLAETLATADEAGAETARRSLETVHRFERMTLEELKAAACPKQCEGGKGLCKKKSQKQSKGNKPGKQEDARDKVNSAGGAGDRGTGW